MTRGQHAILRVAKGQIGLDEVAWRDLLSIHGGVDSAANLDPAGFRRVMFVLEAMGFKSKSQKARIGSRPGFATDAQLDMIRGLWRDYAGSDDPAGLNKWLEGKFKVSALRFLPGSAAAKVIQGLKVMVARKKMASGATPDSDGPTAA